MKFNNTNKISIFYHLYIPDPSASWIWFVDEQINLLKKTGLTENATVNMCITLPLLLFGKIKNKDFCYSDLVIDYITKNYSFVNIVNLRDVNDENLYEGQTLKCLYDYSMNNNGYVFYFHSKDITGGTFKSTGILDEGKKWRQHMNYWCIERWEDCVKKLNEGYDCVGSNYYKFFYPFSGNFWWSTTDHIRRLDDPLDIQKYYDMHDHYRYAFELWIGSKKDTIDIKHFYLDGEKINEI